jgi:DNA-binding response OmpR family regulator
VLVVEDDRTARRAIALILKDSGFAVSEAATLAEALEKSAVNPDWILLDLMLPDGNGIELLHRVRAGMLSSRVCVVTGCGPALQSEARNLAPDHFFTKPLDVDALLALMTAY